MFPLEPRLQTILSLEENGLSDGGEALDSEELFSLQFMFIGIILKLFRSNLQ